MSGGGKLALLDRFFYRADEDVSGLLELHVPQDFEVVPVPEEKVSDFLSFALTSEIYAVPLGEVREIVKVGSITELPRARHDLLGVMNLRGEVLPVYDLRLRLGLVKEQAPIAGPDAIAAPKGSRIVVLRSEEGDAGVYVDEVRGVVKLRPSAIEAPARGVVSGERDCITGIGRHEEQLVILIDPAEALA